MTNGKSQRRSNQLRDVKVKRRFTGATPGSVLYQAGKTTVLCTASVSSEVPRWMAGEGRGWITAEYNMLPGSTQPRKARERGGKIDGRTTEIQRLIGRSFRAVADLQALGERLVTVNCDVLEADGGTRTASVTGGFLALVNALLAVRQQLPDPDCFPLRDSVAAVSVGIVGASMLLDLDYQQDFKARVNMNVVMTGGGQFIEVQGTGEEATFSEEELAAMLKSARRGIRQLTDVQRNSLGRQWPFG